MKLRFNSSKAVGQVLLTHNEACNIFSNIFLEDENINEVSHDTLGIVITDESEIMNKHIFRPVILIDNNIAKTIDRR